MTSARRPGKRPGAWHVLAVAMLAPWGCSCDRPASPADSSLWVDLAPDRSRPPDLPMPDLGPPYLAADRPMPDLARRDFGQVDPKICGGSRKLLPMPVAKYAPTPCGKACKQLTFGNYVEPEYEVAGNLLVYIGDRYVTGTGTSDKVYYVDLKAGKEWLS